MKENSLIQNEEIDHRVNRYITAYDQFGYITFELQADEYEALSKLTTSYRLVRKQPDFNNESWLEGIRKKGLLDNDKAFYVFSFLMLEWKSSTHISAKKNNNNILLEIIDRTRQQNH